MSSLSVVLQADTSGFTSAIENAKKLLEQYANKNKQLADQIKSSTGVTDEQVNAYKRVIRQFEKISSGTMSVTQQEKALANQIKELKIQWQNLSETAKSSDFGKAISESTRTAQQQLKQLRTQIKAVSGDMDDSSGKVENLSSKLGSSLVSNIVSLAGKLGILAGALKIAKDAFVSTETGADQWGSAVASAQTAYKVFLTTLNNGDWSNFFRNLNNAIGGSIELYKKLDRLNSIKTNNQAAIALVEKQLAELRLQKEQGKNVDEEIKRAEARLFVLRNQEVQAGQEAGRDQIIQAIKKQYGGINERIAGKLADSIIKNGPFFLDKVDEKIAELQEKAGTKKVTYAYSNPFSGNTQTNEKTEIAVENLSASERELLKVLQAVHDAEGDMTDGIITYTSATRTAIQANQELYKYNKWGNNKTTTKTTEPDLKVKPLDLTVNPINWDRTEKQIDEEIAKIQKKIKETPEGALRIKLQADLSTLEEEKKNFGKDPIKVKLEAEVANLDLSGVKNADLTIGIGDKSEVLKKNAEGINEMLSSSERLYSVWNRIGDSFDNGNIIEQFFAISNAISSTIDSVQNLISGFQKVGEAVQQLQEIYSAASQQKLQEDSAETTSNLAKASSASSAAIAEGTHKAVSTSKTWQEVIIAIAAVISAITAALAIAGKFANGGIVQGKSSIGDYNLIRVNSGEMVINKTQQAKLFKILNGQLNPVSNNNLSGDVRFKVEGSALVGVLNNYNKKRSNI